jgi:hypothetical protein
LPQALRLSGVNSGKVLINCRLRLQFPHHACQRCSVVVKFGFLHSTLPIVIAEEREHLIERLGQVVQNVRERSPLPIAKEIFAR